jgi:DNA helicase-2/ATP-dependent DNA helicase PcrA
MVRYLRRFGRLINLPNNFSVLDADDSKKAIKEALKTFDGAPMGITLKPEQCINEISRAKSREEDAQAFATRLRREQATDASSVAVRLAVAEVYFEYEAALERMNGLDFDDLLLKGCALLRQPGVVSNVLHVLVDEFQDTNTTQYTLMSLFAAATTSNLLAAPGLLPPGGWTSEDTQPVGLSIVGDPDQSIYAWRNAEVTNLEKMFGMFSGTRRVKLEENFRSTGAILEASLRVVEQGEAHARVSHALLTPVLQTQSASPRASTRRTPPACPSCSRRTPRPAPKRPLSRPKSSGWLRIPAGCWITTT